MNKVFFMFVLVFFLPSIIFAEEATVVIRPPDLWVREFTTPLYFLPPSEVQVKATFTNPNEFDEYLYNISIANTLYSNLSLPELFPKNETKTISFVLHAEERKDPDFYFYNYRKIESFLNAGTRFTIWGTLVDAYLDYAYLPQNPRWENLNRTIYVIHICNESYHPHQLINASGTLLICSNNCSENYMWRDAHFPEVDSISVSPLVADGTKETEITTTPVVTTFVSDKNCHKDIYKAYLTVISPNGTKVMKDAEMKCYPHNFTSKRCERAVTNCTEFGNYSVEIKVVDWEGLTGFGKKSNLFRVMDLSVNITNFYGNTTDFFLEGNARVIPDNVNITNVVNAIYCGYVDPPYAGGGVEKCGIFNKCNYLGGGKFRCYIRDPKLTGVLTNVSFIITTKYNSLNISGYDTKTINLSGTIDSVKVSINKTFFNIFEPIGFSMNFSNYGNIGWHGEVFNQTRISVYSTKNPLNEDLYVLSEKSRDSFVNVPTGKKGRNFFYVGRTNHVLGTYKDHVADLKYLWPEVYNSYGRPPINFSITKKNISGLEYTVAAMDITEYELPKEAERGDMVVGKVKSYFVGSMDLDYWEVIQAFKYLSTDKNSVGKFWVTKYDMIRDKEVPELGNESKKLDMKFDESSNFWEAEIDTFNLSCDNNETIHRVYFMINWTNYGIYAPYVKGIFNPTYYPYFYQNIKIICRSRELFEVIPQTANIMLGEKDRDLWRVSILNKERNPIKVDLLLVSRHYPDAVYWLNFRGNNTPCGEGCKKITLTLPGYQNQSELSGASTIVHLIKAPRLGNYEFDFIVKEANTGKELYRKKTWLNIYSEAIGSENILYLILVFLCVTAVCLL